MSKNWNHFAGGMLGVLAVVVASQSGAQPPAAAPSHPAPPRLLQITATVIADEEAESASPKPASLMQLKLDSSRRVLNGLVTEDFEEIEAAAEAMLKTAIGPDQLRGLDSGDDKVYSHFLNEFGRLASELKEMAQRRNLEGAAYLHSNLTANCIACHQHLRDSQTKIELLDGRH